MNTTFVLVEKGKLFELTFVDDPPGSQVRSWWCNFQAKNLFDSLVDSGRLVGFSVWVPDQFMVAVPVEDKKQ